MVAQKTSRHMLTTQGATQNIQEFEHIAQTIRAMNLRR